MDMLIITLDLNIESTGVPYPTMFQTIVLWRSFDAVFVLSNIILNKPVKSLETN